MYCDVRPNNPLRFASIGAPYKVVGLIALGALYLPEIGDSGQTMIESGSVVYFRGYSPVVYSACKGRAHMFMILPDSFLRSRGTI